MKASVNTDRCKACGLCIIHCPVKAIRLTDHFNEGGYKTIQVDQSVCIGCGVCYTVCPDGVFSILQEERE